MTVYRQRVDEAIASGKLWRAKEILQGRLANSSYDTELFLNYGRVLEAMGDLRVAGKYFFLSGDRSPEHIDSLDIFMERDFTGPFSNFWGTMPKAARKSPKAMVPPIVIEELTSLGFHRSEIDSEFKKIERILAESKAQAEDPRSITERVVLWSVMALPILLVFGLLFQAISGVIALARLVVNWIGS